MKIYIAYKHLGENETQLRKILEDIAKEIHQSGHKTFIYFRDIQKWGTKPCTLSPKQLIIKAFAHLRQCKAILIIINSDEKSEGMLLEIGYAKALGKKIILAVDKKLEKDFLRFVRGISDYTFEFKNQRDLKKNLKTFLAKIF